MPSKIKIYCILYFIALIRATVYGSTSQLLDNFTYLHEIDHSIHQQLEFATNENCVGQKLDGYEGNQAISTIALANELKKVQVSLKKINPHYSLSIQDAYRPVAAVEHIKRWAADVNDSKTKEKYYPDLDKKDLLGKYVAAGKSSHSRGSTVDVIIIDTRNDQALDFGPNYFGDYAHYNYAGLTELQRKNRLMLRELMLSYHFKPYDDEFWHFTLKDEPFPNTYFDFAIKNRKVPSISLNHTSHRKKTIQ